MHNGKSLHLASHKVPSATALKATETSLDAVASEPAPAKTSFIDSIWNENTKLTAYLAIWYLGNIYYNIYNKKACIALGKNAHGGSNLHWALSAAQVSASESY